MNILNAQLRSDAIADLDFHVVEVEGAEQISRPYAFRVTLVAHHGKMLDEDAALASAACLVLLVDGVIVRQIHGVINEIVTDLRTGSGNQSWTLRLVPRFAELALTTTSEVELEQTVPDIVADRLQRAGLVLGLDFELNLLGAYAPRDCVVQYKENHLDFIGRLCEHLGISYFFRQTEEREIVVFCDENSGLVTENDGVRIAYEPRGEKVGVYEMSSVVRTQTSKVRVRDYNYRTPRTDLSAAEGAENGESESYEYGAHFKTPEEGRRIAQVRLEELACQRRVYRGKSNRWQVSAATRFGLERHPTGDKQLLVVQSTHFLTQPLGANTGATYSNTFQAIDSAVPFRAARVSPKPFVPGVITGVVEAEQAGDYAEVDGDGRYHVRFAFDVGGAKRGKASRPIRMAQPHAGPGYGMHFPLRDGVEVVLSCVEGDPDRPIISGAVPNPTTPSVVNTRNGSRNVIRTGGGSEVNIDDVAGTERVKITVPFGNTTLQLGAPNAPHPGIYMGTDNSVHVTSASGMDFVDATAITASAPESTIHGALTATLKSGISANVVGGAEVNVSAPAVSTTASDTISLTAGGTYEEAAPVVISNAGGVWSASSGAATLLHGGATVTISGPTITISGDLLSINASGQLDIVAGGVVNVSAPTVNVSGANVSVSGDGVVNVKGGTIKLNS